jgi:uncharacterized protein (DUF58 family)
MTQDPSTITHDQSLLSSDFMHRLERLDVLSRKILRGKLQGERRSKKRGQSVEFADYRNYVVGDDLRFIDWNLYARLDKLFLRLFMEEEDLSVTILVDTTGSMDYGDPNKLLYAKRVAAALGYIGLVKYNRVSIFGFTNTIDRQLRHMRGRRPIPQLLEFVDQMQVDPDQQTPGNLANVTKQLALLQHQPGVVIILSDFFDKGDLNDALRYLSNPRYDVYAIQTLCPQEVDPVKGQLVGDLRLRDIEDGDVAEVAMSPALVKRYKANLQAYCQHVREQCMRRGTAYMISETSAPFETLILRYLRERGLLG